MPLWYQFVFDDLIVPLLLQPLNINYFYFYYDYLFLFVVVVVDNFEEEKFKIEKGASYIRIKESQLLL